MKINTPTLIAILFIVLSIWLSFSVKKANEALFDAQTQLKTKEQELNISKYQADILLEVLELNIGKAPIPTRQTTSSRLTSNKFAAAIKLYPTRLSTPGRLTSNQNNPKSTFLPPVTQATLV